MMSFKFIHRIAEGLPIPVYGDGSQERDFTYIDDIARGAISALRPLGFEVINLGSDRPVKLNHVIHLTMLGQEVPNRIPTSPPSKCSRNLG